MFQIDCYLFIENVYSRVSWVVLLLVQGISRTEAEHAIKMIQGPISCPFSCPFSRHSSNLLSSHLDLYLHCSHKPAGDTLNPCGIPGRTGVLLGAGSWSMGAEGVCVSATVLEPGSLKVTIGTPDPDPRAAPETALNPTFPCSPPCTASCSSRCLLFLNLLLQ